MCAKRILISGLALLFCGLLLGAGCSKPPQEVAPPGPDLAAPGPAETATGEKPVKLSLWTGPNIKLVKGHEAETPDYGDYEKLLAAEFMKEHPEVSIEVQVLQWEDLPKKVPAAVIGGNPPNLLIEYLGRTSGYAYEGVLEPLEELIPQAELEDYDPKYLQMFQINGHLHALPMFSWANVLVGNRTMWEEAGAADLLPPLEDPNWTFEGFHAALKAVAKKDAVWPLGLQVASEQGDYAVLGYLWGMGAKLYENGDYSHVALNSPKGIKGLEFLVQLVREELIQPQATTIQGNALDNMFWQWKTAIAGDSLRQWNMLEAAKKEGKLKRPMELFLAHFPHAEGVTNGVAVGPTGVCVFKQDDPEKRKWAVEFARFLNTPERQREYCLSGGWFPTRKSTDNPCPNDPNYAAVKKLIDKRGLVDMGLTSPKYYKVRVLLPPQLQAAFLGKKTPAQALADFEQEANRVLAEG